ncbi:hypothetical protein FHG66_12100 [Rubellimicrobium rubrum]|uniref:Uncharacterized protein n=1 Tax=Rubellimicrobium rubrum TaxID=2585369 RepID=A0A5C4MX43_9RHOB|nr:hypothetical protein [Rubellimicrobium rubrum]TNC49184.1 hypothetical protein FHG66_12100 [Rubellimicrobium rubrum]
MIVISRQTLAASVMALTLWSQGAQAQGVLDRLLGDDPGRSIAPADLVTAGIWVYDPIQGLSNFPEDQMLPGPHMLVVLTRNTQVPSVVLRLDTGTECVRAATSMTGVHGGGAAYCHPLTP